LLIFPLSPSLSLSLPLSPSLSLSISSSLSLSLSLYLYLSISHYISLSLISPSLSLSLTIYFSLSLSLSSLLSLPPRTHSKLSPFFCVASEVEIRESLIPDITPTLSCHGKVNNWNVLFKFVVEVKWDQFVLML
jgi:hypothetical protein